MEATTSFLWSGYLESGRSIENSILGNFSGSGYGQDEGTQTDFEGLMSSAPAEVLSDTRKELESITRQVDRGAIKATEEWAKKTDTVNSAMVKLEEAGRTNTKVYKKLARMYDRLASKDLSQQAQQAINPQDVAGEVEAAGTTSEGVSIPTTLEPVPGMYERVTGWDRFMSNVEDGLKSTITRSVQSAAQNLGNDLVSIFSPGDTDTTRLKLQRHRLQKQQRQLRESLKQREISYREYTLRVQQLNNKLGKNSQKLAQETASVWKKTFKSLGDFALSIIQQVISKLISAITTAIVLKVITQMIPGASSGSIGTLFGSALGGGGFSSVSFNADGGVYKSPTLGMVGEYPNAKSDPEIISPESKMRDVFASTLQTHGAGAGAGMNITVRVQGESSVEGRDIKQSYDTETRVRGRQGIE
jgi:hypothetical protein